jgi:hypothetical protein
MKRLRVAILAAVMASGLAGVPTASAVGACIGPITKSAVYTYADRFSNVMWGDPVRYYKFKMTGRFCYDSLGNAWGVSPITWAVVSGPFIGLSNNPVYVTGSGFAYAKIAYGYYRVSGDAVIKIRIGPKLKISGVNGRFTAFDTEAFVVNGAGQILHDFDPVFVSAVLQ